MAAAAGPVDRLPPGGRWDLGLRVLRGGTWVGLALFLGLCVTIDLVSALHTGWGGVPGLVGGMAVAISVLWFRRDPDRATAMAVLVTLSLAAAGVWSPLDVSLSAATMVGLGVVVFLGLRHLRTRSVAPLVALVVLAACAAPLPAAMNPLISTVVVAVFLSPLLVSGAYLRWLDWRQEDAALRAREDERLELARDLHDLVAHYVTGIVVEAQGAQLVAEDDPAGASAHLVTIEAAGRDALTAMREMVGSLRSPRSGPEPLHPVGAVGLRDLVEAANRFGSRTRLVVHDLDPDELPVALATSVQRIVQESLTNVRRHAVDATDTEVQLHGTGDGLHVIVRDDGRTARRPHRGSGFGLVGMEERALALGGELAAGPGPGGGWEVRAHLPLPGHVSRTTPPTVAPSPTTTP